MKIIKSSNKNDFAASFFSRIFWDGNNALDNKKQRPLIAKHFNIEENRLRSIKDINSEIRKKLFLEYKTDFYAEDFNKISNYFEIPNDRLVQKIMTETNLVLENYINLLTSLFGESKIKDKEIEISFINAKVIDFYYGFTFNFLENKMFIFILDKPGEEQKTLPYLMTILHEMTHLFINGNLEFYRIFKKIWKEEFDYLKGSHFRSFIEENIVNSLANGNRESGYCYEYLNIKENSEVKKKDLKDHKSRKIIFDFLDNLQKNKSKNKLEEESYKLISDLKKIGVFIDKRK